MKHPLAEGVPTWRLLLAIFIPFLAFLAQWLFWSAIRPYSWFLFFPAVFFSSWVGGFYGGLAATVLSTALATFFFISPDPTVLARNPMSLISIGMFMGMGALFSFSHGRLRRANLQAANALEQATEANARLRDANGKITQLYEKTLELDELKTQFFANVSHELRTPLTLILGPLEKHLDDGNLPEQALRDLAVAHRNASLLHRHVTDLLDVAKLEAGSMTLRYAAFDLAHGTRLWASHFESLATDHGTGLTLCLPSELPIQADAEKCQRIVLNLLSNAFKFTPPGGRVGLSLERQGGSAVLQVRDNGPGVPPVMREAVFERFRQAEGNASRRFGGTGLGLAIVKEFAQLHGGNVTLEEAPGGGALFTVALPLTAPEGADVRPAPDSLDDNLAGQLAREQCPVPEDAPSGAHRAGNAPLVLVVEDNPDMNAFICDTLARGYRVARAHNGCEGLELALELKPDLILSDVMMPGASGDTMVQELRRHGEFDDVPVVMLTAKADDSLRLRLLQCGVQDYITKPFSSAELLARVDGLLRDRRRHEAERRESRRHFQATFEQAAVGIAHIDADGGWLLANRTLCDILGFELADLLKTPLDKLIPPDGIDNGRPLAARLVSGEAESLSHETRCVRGDGQLIWVRATASRVRGETGETDYLIVVVEDIQPRKLAEESLRRSMAEKEMLLREIHHRVKNNLQVITSLINLQVAPSANPSELERAETLEWRIRSMALIHEQLYRHGDLSAVDLAGYIRALAERLSLFFSDRTGKVALDIETVPVSLGIDKAVPCGLLVNELVTNAFKHARPDGGDWSLRITLACEDDTAILAIEDDGRGFPPGFDPGQSKTLGFQLVSELVRQLKGRLSVTSDAGSRVEVRFPARETCPQPDPPGA